MFLKGVIVLALAGLAACYEHGLSERTTYQGPPAPLNHDGTVAYTHEFQEVSAIHNAAHAHEYQRLQEVESLAAAHPDLTSPKSQDYNQHYDKGNYDTTVQDDGQYKPHMYENKHYNSGDDRRVGYSPSTIHHQQQHYQTPSYSQTYNPSQIKQAHVPAPLNPDGTVAQTPEFNAIATSLQNAYHQAVRRHRRSVGYYHGPPAPLNHDGTVANTPEVQHAIQVHNAAYANQHRLLQEAEALAAAHPDLSSHMDYNYGPHYDSMYNSVQNDVWQSSLPTSNINHNQYSTVHHIQPTSNVNHNQYSTVHHSQPTAYHYNPQAHIPAPLNHDGTVAHTPEYRAIAAYHHAEREKILSNHQRLMMYNRPHLIDGYHNQMKW